MDTIVQAAWEVIKTAIASASHRFLPCAPISCVLLYVQLRYYSVPELAEARSGILVCRSFVERMIFRAPSLSLTRSSLVHHSGVQCFRPFRLAVPGLPVNLFFPPLSDSPPPPHHSPTRLRCCTFFHITLRHHVLFVLFYLPSP